MEFNLLKKLSEIIPESTAHGSGKKFVFRRNDEMTNASTQIAFGHFKAGEKCEEHTHLTMFEYFFFIEGRGTYVVEGKIFHLLPNSFLEIPAGYKHSLHANEGEDLKFVYWGVAID